MLKVTYSFKCPSIRQFRRPATASSAQSHVLVQMPLYPYFGEKMFLVCFSAVFDAKRNGPAVLSCFKF